VRLVHGDDSGAQAGKEADDQIAPRRIGNDHLVADGGSAANRFGKSRDLIEKPLKGERLTMSGTVDEPVGDVVGPRCSRFAQFIENPGPDIDLPGIFQANPEFSAGSPNSS
jgi:hypothetical protein